MKGLQGKDREGPKPRSLGPLLIHRNDHQLGSSSEPWCPAILLGFVYVGKVSSVIEQQLLLSPDTGLTQSSNPSITMTWLVFLDTSPS